MYLFVNVISNEKNGGRAAKYEKEFVLGKRSLNFVMPCWSEYDKGFPIGLIRKIPTLKPLYLGI